MAGWPGIFVRPVTGPGVEPLPGTPARIWATTAREACVCGGGAAPVPKAPLGRLPAWAEGCGLIISSVLGEGVSLAVNKGF